MGLSKNSESNEVVPRALELDALHGDVLAALAAVRQHLHAKRVGDIARRKI